MIAFVDESILLAGHGCYVLGCVVLPADDKAQVRRAARKAIPAGRTFHWTKERPEVRHAMLQVIADHATHLLAYSHRPVVRREHEGARAELLNALLDDLSAANVRELVLESRQDHNDARDRQVIGSRSQRGDASLDYRHEGPRQEPLLWLADALAGAVMSQIRKDNRFIAALPADRLAIRSH
ncbi:MAG TPA: hypothetical protein VG520_02035 [Candidatus Dormibacteraeota bacterium]|nr:hypothetical protein [Candidatus Dormibacteraeota bacterium]